MARGVQVLGYLVLVFAVVGELQFVGFLLYLPACGYSSLCSGVSGSTGDGVPLSLYYSYGIWNAVTYAVLALVGVALVMLHERDAQRSSAQPGR